MIVVYGKDNCPACRQTTMLLDRKGIPYAYNKVVDAEGNPLGEACSQYLSYFRSKGYKQFPVVNVTYPDDSKDEWSGFQPQKLKQYVYSVLTSRK